MTEEKKTKKGVSGNTPRAAKKTTRGWFWALLAVALLGAVVWFFNWGPGSDFSDFVRAGFGLNETEKGGQELGLASADGQKTEPPPALTPPPGDGTSSLTEEAQALLREIRDCACDEPTAALTPPPAAKLEPAAVKKSAAPAKKKRPAKAKKAETGRLWVWVEPQAARENSGLKIRVMNIGPSYTEKMSLPVGQYDILVEAPGWKPYREWHPVKADRINRVLVTLIPVPPPAAPVAPATPAEPVVINGFQQDWGVSAPVKPVPTALVHVGDSVLDAPPPCGDGDCSSAVAYTGLTRVSSPAGMDRAVTWAFPKGKARNEPNGPWFSLALYKRADKRGQTWFKGVVPGDSRIIYFNLGGGLSSWSNIPVDIQSALIEHYEHILANYQKMPEDSPEKTKCLKLNGHWDGQRWVLSKNLDTP